MITVFEERYRKEFPKFKDVNRPRGIFLANLAHKRKNPLIKIKTSARIYSTLLWPSSCTPFVRNRQTVPHICHDITWEASFAYNGLPESRERAKLSPRNTYASSFWKCEALLSLFSAFSNAKFLPFLLFSITASAQIVQIITILNNNWSTVRHFIRISSRRFSPAILIVRSNYKSTQNVRRQFLEPLRQYSSHSTDLQSAVLFSSFILPRIVLGFKQRRSRRVGRGSGSYRILRKESSLLSLSGEPIVLLRMDGNNGRGYWMYLGIISSGIGSGRFVNKDV